jgi:hypothetical protein
MTEPESKPKRQCPFQGSAYRCNPKCEWFDSAKDQCLMWSFHSNVSEFIKVIQDYISLQLKIQAGPK